MIDFDPEDTSMINFISQVHLMGNFPILMLAVSIEEC